jgi:glutathione peroxidase
MSKSIYDINIKSWDGQEDFLAQFKDKVVLMTNTTADCGNAPQFGILEEIYRKYKDQGFEILAIPTNQYCGKGVTYGSWENGIETAEDSKKYAEDTYDVTYNFSEILVSKPGPGAPKGLKEGEIPHELFEELVDQTDNTLMYGNFEKYLVGKDGKVIRKYPNGSLLDYAVNAGVPDAKSEYERICSDIEAALANDITPRRHLHDEYPEIAKLSPSSK